GGSAARNSQFDDCCLPRRQAASSIIMWSTLPNHRNSAPLHLAWLARGTARVVRHTHGMPCTTTEITMTDREARAARNKERRLMTKVSDTQRLILSAAAQHEMGLGPRAEDPAGRGAQRGVPQPDQEQPAHRDQRPAGACRLGLAPG
ncbi:hypothetical protein, partial [Falsiroseomonas sp. E2-1-a4]|uniref:hypothetical protein n=1 Tax=Falsiroseomonas sp. E2-1-a4 TaxID=3239299 RepID=UPI003F346114